MARTATKKTESTAIANWDEELARSAKTAAALAPSGEGGTFITMRAGIMKFNDAALPGNQMCAIIGSWCLENVYYDDVFDPDNVTPPTCFAFCKSADDKDEMGPPSDTVTDDCFDWQAETCKGCPQNEWGSARTGKCKACSNRRRLALLAGGTYTPKGKNAGFELELFDSVEHFKKADVAFLKVPVMSGKGFDAYVRQLEEMFQRPTWAVYTNITSVPDDRSQFKLEFEMLEKVPHDLLEVMRARHNELDKGINFAYRPMAEEEAKPATRTATKVGRKAAPAAKGKR